MGVVIMKIRSVIFGSLALTLACLLALGVTQDEKIPAGKESIPIQELSAKIDGLEHRLIRIEKIMAAVAEKLGIEIDQEIDKATELGIKLDLWQQEKEIERDR